MTTDTFSSLYLDGEFSFVANEKLNLRTRQKDEEIASLQTQNAQLEVIKIARIFYHKIYDPSPIVNFLGISKCIAGGGKLLEFKEFPARRGCHRFTEIKRTNLVIAKAIGDISSFIGRKGGRIGSHDVGYEGHQTHVLLSHRGVGRTGVDGRKATISRFVTFAQFR